MGSAQRCSIGAGRPPFGPAGPVRWQRTLSLRHSPLHHILRVWATSTTLAHTCQPPPGPPHPSTASAHPMAKLGDVLFKGTVATLVAVTILGGISVSMSMAERFAFHRQQVRGRRRRRRCLHVCCCSRSLVYLQRAHPVPAACPAAEQGAGDRGRCGARGPAAAVTPPRAADAMPRLLRSRAQQCHHAIAPLVLSAPSACYPLYLLAAACPVPLPCMYPP